MYLVLAHKGKHLDVTDRTKPKDVIRALGEPTKSWDDGVEKCLTYESEGTTVSFMFCVRHFFFKPEGKLKGVEIEPCDGDKKQETA
jgi:hypothetical protein